MSESRKRELVRLLTERETDTGPLSQARIDELCAIIYGYLGGQITLSDTKAQLTLAADALLASAILSLDKSVLLGVFDASTPLLTRLATMLIIAMFGALVVSIYYSLRVARPTLIPSKSSNMFYFVDVTRMTEEDFRTKFLTQTPDDVTDALLEEVYLLSTIAYRKFERIAHSLNWLLVAFVLWGLAQVLYTFAG
ncbi:MAG: hypothetical protein KIT87_18230 [Anaerolineae bacterium]|nr:hypothetical protein [Anaerolineae bacterium]